MARRLAPSTIACDQSISPAAPRRSRTARWCFAHKTASDHSVERRCAIWWETPKVGGRCRQAQPVVSTNEEFSEAGEVPDDIAECDVDAPETVHEPEAPDVHHKAYVVTYEDRLFFSVPATTFNGLSNGDHEHLTLPERAEIDVHCVRTTMNVVEEPPSTSYNEEVPYYLVTHDGHTGYVDPLWVYFAHDPSEVPAVLDYDADTGTVSDHGNVLELQECPAD